jgi:hypothetical protein
LLDPVCGDAFCQLGRAHSLREICGGLASCLGKVHEINVARRLRFEPGTILVMDTGHLDYRWLDELTAQGVYFVTPLKDSAVIEEAAPCPIPKGGQIKRDEIIALAGSGRSFNPDRVLGRIMVVVPQTREELVLLTNQFDFSPVTIAAIYREGWQVELLFKALKQNLKIKTFVGTSANALHIQIWTAVFGHRSAHPRQEEHEPVGQCLAPCRARGLGAANPGTAASGCGSETAAGMLL